MSDQITITKEHIKRPANHFMIWSCEKRQEHLIEKSKNKNKCNVKINNSEMSKMLGREWAELPNECKLKYKLKADILKREHKLMYPNYKYEPKSKKLKNTRSPRIKKNLKPIESNIYELEYTNEGIVKKYMVCTTTTSDTYNLDEPSIDNIKKKKINKFIKIDENVCPDTYIDTYISIETSIDTYFSTIMEHIFADKSNTSDVCDI
jgi:hypothetical protein